MKTRLPAYALQLGDTVASGERVVETYAGARTPPGKIHVVLDNPKGFRRVALWGKHTLIGVERPSLTGVEPEVSSG